MSIQACAYGFLLATAFTVSARAVDDRSVNVAGLCAGHRDDPSPRDAPREQPRARGQRHGS
jgi:hypothetical protein